MLKKMRKQIVSLGLFGAVTAGTFLPGLAVSPVYALENEESVTEATEEVNVTEPTEATGAGEAEAITADPDNEPEDATEEEALMVQSEEAIENNFEDTADEAVDTKENVKSSSGVGETKSGAENAENADSVKAEQVKNGWVKENGGYSYYDNGTKYTGWHYMTSKEGEKTPHWSFFGNDGRIRTGWVQLGKGTSNPDGNAEKHWSYFGDNGWLRTGWVQLGKGTSNPDGNTAKHWSYFGDNGWLRTGWVQLGKGTSNPDGNAAKHWSFFGDNGWLRTGWVQLGKGTSNPDGNAAKHWSFFGDNGWLRTGWVQLGKGTSNPDGNAAKHWSYFGDNGWLRTGWVQLGKGTANPDGNSAKHWSYFGDNGWLRTEWVQFGKGTSEPDGDTAKHWSYFGPNGWLRTGWQDMGKGTSNPDSNSAKHRSYFGDNGWLRTGMQLIDGKKYEFDGRGWLRYSDATIPPKEQPEEVWNGIYNIEVRFSNGVHLYLPSFSTGYFYEGWEPHGNFGWDYFPEGGNNRLIYFNFIGEKVYSGQNYFKVNTNKLHVTAQEAEIDIAVENGNSLPLDNQFNSYREIGVVGGKTYYIDFSMPSSWYSDWYEYDSGYYREFADKIVNSAWVE